MALKFSYYNRIGEMAGHTHDYYGKSGEINAKAWEFIKKHDLKAEPKYEKINFR